MNIDEMKKLGGYWYLATPYSKYVDGIEMAFKLAAIYSAALIKAGLGVYSPIAHTHTIAMCGGLDPMDHSIWLPADRPLMDAAVGLIVCQMAGWLESHGVAHEIDVFCEADKPVYYWQPLDDPVLARESINEGI